MTRTFLTIAALCLLSLPALADSPNDPSYSVTSNSTIDWIPVTGATQIMGSGTAQEAATVDLIAPDVLYGRLTNQVVVSRHGYVAWGDSDDGTDNSPDCPLPAKPSNTLNSETRLYPFHADLTNDSEVFYEYVAPGTHSSSRWGAHVFTWTGAKLAAGSAGIDFQALVFDDFKIVFQYQTTGTFGDDIAVGLQGLGTGSEFLSVYCDLTGAFVGNHQLVIEPPTVNFSTSGVTPVGFAQALALFPDGTRICFTDLGTANISVGSSVNLQKTVALVAPASGPVTFLGTTLSYPDGGAMLGMNPNNGGASSANDLLIRDSVLVNNITVQTAVTAPRLIAFDSTFDNCVDTGSNGGGAIRTGELHATDCAFTDCEATGTAIITQGGAIKLTSTTANSTLTRCTFENNSTSGAGGAVYSIGGTLDLTDCTFDGNSSDGVQSGINTGGAVVYSNTNGTVQRCLFTNNDGGQTGGALAVSGTSSVNLRNSAFDDNSADDLSAIAHFGDLLDIRHCNIVRHSNNDSGGFIIGGNDSPTTTKYTAYIDNTGDIADTASTNFDSLGFNSYSSNTTNPLFDALGDALSSGSPGTFITSLPGGTSRTPLTIDRSDLTNAAATGSLTDLRGNPRFLGTNIDIGAFEYVESVVVDSTLDDPTPGGPVSLREAWAISDKEILFDPSLNNGTIVLTSPLPERQRETSVRFDVPTPTFDGQFVTIDGSAIGPISVDADTTWRNVHFTGFPGYAITCAPSDRTQVIHCDFTDNAGAISGPFADTDGINRLELTSSRFYENGASVAPLPVIDTRRTVVINCQFDHNLGPVFQLMPNDTLLPALTLTNSTIARNNSRAIIAPAFPSNTDRTVIDLIFSTISTNAADNGFTIQTTHPTDLSLTRCTVANNGGDTATSNPCIRIEDGSSTITTDSSVYENNKVTFNDQGIITSLGGNIFDNDTSDSWLLGSDLENTKTHLAPLSRYLTPAGTSRMPELKHALLAISPAIDTATSGYGSSQDGDADGSFVRDRGAFEAGPVTFVTATGNSGAGSLRQAIIDTPPGGRILIDPSVSITSSIFLASDLNITEDVQIDGTDRRRGITINGDNTTRIFDVQNGARFAIHGFRLVNGAGAGNFSSGLRIRDGRGTASHGSITNCSAVRGAAAYVEIGGLYLMNCTISGNSTTASGGALDFLAGTENRLEHCTIANNFSDNGGALRFRSGCLVRGGYNLIANNFLGTSAAPGVAADFFVGDESTFPDRFISAGPNLTTDTSTGIDAALSAPGDQTNITPPGLTTSFDASGWGLAIGNMGAPSFADIDATPPVFPTFDVRGYVRVAGSGIDIGSREFGGDTLDTDGDSLPDYWEYLYGFNAIFNTNTTSNPDNDGADNLTEFQNGTNPLVFDVPLVLVLPEVLSFGRDFVDPTLVSVTFQGPAGVEYRFQASTDLENWTTLFSVTTSGMPQTVSQSIAIEDRRFFRFATPDPE